MVVANELKVHTVSSEVNKAISLMANSIAHKTPKVENIVFILILKGGLYVGMKLLDLFPNNPFGLIGFSSYGKGTEPRKITYTSMLDLSPDYLKGKDVWLIDDVAQTGATFTMATRVLVTVGVRSIHTAALVRKTKYGKFEPDVIGVRYNEDKFLVGCGMGLGEEYRTLPYLAELLKEPR